jgi:hypothetical protein
MESISDVIFSTWVSTESALIEKLSWPAWALRTVELLFAILVLLFVIEFLFLSSPNGVEKLGTQKISAAFRWFQLQYISVYLIIMLADWLQGTNMYTLYASYKVDIGALFITGFLSSAIFGTFLGVYVDRWGRRLGCLIFCVLEILINILEHVPSMPVLIAGTRLLLLFSKMSNRCIIFIINNYRYYCSHLN